MKRPHRLVIVALLLIAFRLGCSSPAAEQRAAESELAASPAPAQTQRDERDRAPDGNQRLNSAVSPLHYSLDLTIDPREAEFSGRASIRVRISEKSARVQLHGSDLQLTSVQVEQLGKTQRAELESGPHGGLALKLAAPLQVGEAVLHFVWRAPLSETPTGLYRVEESGRWYAFTQFEPLEARNAFPCFDQPEFKTPYQVTLRVPQDMTALSNAPESAHERGEEHARFAFHETKPLPTYLVAFAIGAFDHETVHFAEGGPPSRIIAPAGKGKLSAYAAARTPVILGWLSDYFGQPYPFAKLDQVAVPNFSAGAMENVGLVTYREPLLLLDGERAPIAARRWSQTVIAHELAHMWYGNLVTMAWWDDLWLNESFATWMATKAVAAVAPEFNVELDAVAHTQHIMVLDSRRDARRIRQPIRHGGDVYNAFDGITYGKGAAVLRMLEAWLGEAAFQAGVRAYLARFAYGSGGTDELLAALAEASGQPVAETLRLFLDQPGTPLVTVELECDEGGDVRAALTQTRYLPSGSRATVGEAWDVPMCVAYADPSALDDGRGRECFVFEGRQQVVPLPVDHCPSWLHPNADEQGYYRWSLPPQALVELASEQRAALSEAERVALAGHYGALLESASLPLAPYADALAHLSRDLHPKTLQGVAEALSMLWMTAVDEDESTELFARFTRELLGARLDQIGLLPSSREAAATKLLRTPLVHALADFGERLDIRERARALAAAFVADPSAVPEAHSSLLLPIAAWQGDEALWKGLLAASADAPTPGIRATAIRALGSFEDPELLRRSLGLVLDGRLRAQDYRTLARAVRKSQQKNAWHWLRQNYAAVAARVGPMTAPRLPELAAGLCSAEQARAVETFFANLVAAPQGTERRSQLVLEDIERCAALRDRIRTPLQSYLEERYRGAGDAR